MEKFLLALGIIAIVIGVKFIFDARPIVKVYFGSGKENENVFVMKIVGFALSIIGGILIYYFL